MMHAYYERGCWRWWLGEVNVEFAFPSRWIGFMAQGDSDGESGIRFAFGVGLFALYVGSGKPTQRGREYAYGVSLDADYISVSWYLGDDEMNHMPWMWEWPWRRWHHVRYEVLTDPETHDYVYRLSTGELQQRQATIQAEEREWRWIWRASPVRRVRRYIDVKFSDEVGDRSGSWKGGVIGCGYEMRDGENPINTLRRMERERVFR